MIPGNLPRVLAVAGQQWESVWSVFICGTAIVVATVLLYTALRIWRKRSQAPKATDFGIDDIDKLHRQGLISDEEFSRLRLKALGMTAPKKDGPVRPPEKSVSD
jgi:hypothetical protein